jgi:hypothetical protein
LDTVPSACYFYLCRHLLSGPMLCYAPRDSLCRPPPAKLFQPKRPRLVENYGQGLSFDGIHPSPTGYALMTTKVVADATDRNGRVRYPRVVHLPTPCVLRSIAYQDSPVVSHVGVVCRKRHFLAIWTRSGFCVG